MTITFCYAADIFRFFRVFFLHIFSYILTFFRDTVKNLCYSLVTLI